MFLVQILKFLAFLLFFLYLPPKIIFKLINVKVEDKLLDFGLTAIFGVVLITLLTVLARFFSLNLYVLWLIPAISILYLGLNLKNVTNSLAGWVKELKSRNTFLVAAVLLVGVIAQNLVLFRGGWKTPDGIMFPSLHDTMWNIALSAELFSNFPPQNPAFAGEILKNNHYFYPFFLSVARYFTGVSIYDLYFRFGPILISLLFGLGLYAVVGVFTQNIAFRLIGIFLGYFSGNAAFILPFLLGAKFDWKGNTFFADQPFDQIINPYSVLGFALMLFGIYALSKIQKPNKDFPLGWSIVGGVLLGALYGFKSFGGVIAIPALAVTTLIYVLLTRKLTFVPISVLSGVLFLFIFFLTTDPGKASIVWAPGWLLRQLMTDKDKLNLPRFADLEMYYQSIRNYLGLFKIKLIELTIYLIGNLGTRIVGLVFLLYILLMSYARSRKYIIQFIAFVVFISLAIPLLFNLRNSTFNIIQFTPYSLVLLAVISVYALEKIYQYCVKKHKKTLGILVVIIFIALSVPVNVKNIVGKLESPKDIIANDEIAALDYLRENTKATDVVLIDPNQFSEDPIYVAAISQRRIYLASPGYAIQTGIDPKYRMKEIESFFNSPNREFLKRNKITHIYYLKGNRLTKLDSKPVFENGRVIIWETVSVN